MIVEKKDVRRFLEENDVKFIRLAFTDVFSVQKNISVMPSEMERAVESGIRISSTAVEGYASGRNDDLYLVPDLTTASLLPWRPSSGRVVRFFCSLRRADGSAYELDFRSLLRATQRKLMQRGVSCTLGAQCEFYLLRTDDDGRCTGVPFDDGTYLDAEPRDKGQNVRREICLTLEDMGVSPEQSMHERGPGQNEIDFRHSDALTSADNVMTLKSVVEAIAQQRGLFATFEPKPLENCPGNGFHISMLPYRMSDPQRSVREAFAAGILKFATQMTAFLNPSEQSYLRLGSDSAPSAVSWGRRRGEGLMVIPQPSKLSRGAMTMRSPDSPANPYLAYALLLEAGLYGVENDLELPTEGEETASLPKTLAEAVAAAKESEFVRSILPVEAFDVMFGG